MTKLERAMMNFAENRIRNCIKRERLYTSLYLQADLDEFLIIGLVLNAYSSHRQLLFDFHSVLNNLKIVLTFHYLPLYRKTSNWDPGRGGGAVPFRT